MEAVQANPVLEFSNLWRVAGVPKTLAQNWTNGRPIRLPASISQADGKGSRNLYNVEDAYLLAYLNAARQQGMSSDALERIFFMLTVPLERGPLRRKLASDDWLAISVTKYAVVEHGIEKSKNTPNLVISPLEVSDFHDSVAVLVAVNLKSLRSGVDARAQRLIKKTR